MTSKSLFSKSANHTTVPSNNNNPINISLPTTVDPLKSYYQDCINELQTSTLFSKKAHDSEYEFFTERNLEPPEIPEFFRATTQHQLSTVAQDQILNKLKDCNSFQEFTITVQPMFQETHTFPDVSHLEWIHCKDYLEIFVTCISCFRNEMPIEPARLPPMPIDILPDVPWKPFANFRRMAPHLEKIVEEKTDELLKTSLITHSRSWLRCAIVLANQKGKYRMCVDYRPVNLATVKMNYPLPRIQSILDRLAGNTLFSQLDLKQGYNQIEINEADRWMTSFITHAGQFECIRIPFGLTNGPAYFQFCMATKVLAGLNLTTCYVFFDDVVTPAKTQAGMKQQLKEILMRFAEFNIIVNGKKCHICQHTLTNVLGYTVDGTGISHLQSRKDKLFQIALPQTKSDFMSFIGLAVYFKNHVPNFSITRKEFSDVMNSPGGKHAKISWTPQQIDAWNTLKNDIFRCSKLYHRDPKLPLVVRTDASTKGIGAYTYQIRDGVEEPLSFISLAFNPTQSNWPIQEQEAFAPYFAISTQDYLFRGSTFTLETDHRNLLFMHQATAPKVVRWFLCLQEYDFILKHIPGKLNVIADVFSRIHYDIMKQSIPTISIMDPRCRRPIQSLPETLPSIPLSSSHPLVLATVSFDPEIHFDDATTAPVRPQQSSRIRTYMAEYRKFKTEPALPTIPIEYCAIIETAHNDVIGHCGIDATLRKLKIATRYWPRMREHVTRFIQSCPICQKFWSHPTTPTLIDRTIEVYEPFHTISSDILGPFPEDKRGNKYIHSVVCAASRHATFFPHPSISADVLASDLLKLFSQYAICAEIRSDNGPQYVSDLITAFTKLLAIDHIKIVPYRHESNGQVERFNKEANRHLNVLIFAKQNRDDWSDAPLTIANGIVNNTVNAVTKITPIQYLHGNLFTAYRNILQPFPGPLPMIDSLHQIRQVHIDLVNRSQIYQARASDKRIAQTVTVPSTIFPVGSFVTVTYPQRPPTKLHSKLRGPFLVQAIDNDKYTCQDLPTGKLLSFYADRLRQYTATDQQALEPLEVATRDRGEFIIDRILDHSGIQSRTQSLDFKVRWLGYDESEDLWLPYKNVKDTSALQDYLISAVSQGHRLSKLIDPTYIP